jgi:hypothetical protein
MAAPPFLKKASKRRLDAALPDKGPTKKGGVATFKNPGNKAGKGLMQKGSGEGINPEDNSNADAKSFMAMIASRAGKKPKTKVQPAAARKVAAMKLASKK